MWKKIILTVLICLLIPILIISFPWICMYFFSFAEPNPPSPEITYGEFPFTLEYKIAEDTYVVQDVVICEYDGIKWDEGSGKHRTWKKHLKTLKSENVLILTDGDLEIYCNIGSANYYMGDVKYTLNNPHTPVFYYKNGKISGSTDDLLDKYKIELVNWELSAPIINSFK